MSTYLNIDGARLNSASTTSGRADSLAQPDANDIATFDRALQSRQEGVQQRNSRQETLSGDDAPGSRNTASRAESAQANEKRKGGQRNTVSDTEEQTSPGSTGLMGMTSPLDSLFGQQMPFVDGLAATASVDAPALDTLADMLVERILVAEPNQAGGSEVRISLNQGVLPETEIRLQRAIDGQLTVTLISNNPSSFQTLVAAQDSLRQRLEQRESAGLQVNVSSQTEQESNDSRHRSRGYQEEIHED